MVCLAKQYEFRSLEHSQAQNCYIALNPTPFSLSLSYNDDGCMPNDGTWSFTWNGENRLIIAESADRKLEFSYDYMGRRIEKKVYSGSPGNWTLEKHLRFVYDGYLQIEELDALDSNSISKKRVWEPGGNRLLSVSHSSLGAFTSFYAMADSNKNITEYIDASGSVQAHFEYSPFGKITSASGSNPDAFDFRFSSEYFDSETDLVYYNYRYYSPEFGRWLSRDPIEEKGGMNLYGIVGNNSIMKWDRLGLTVYVEKQHATAVGLTSGRYAAVITKISTTTYSEYDSTCPPPVCRKYTVFCKGNVVIKGSTWISLLPKLASTNLTDTEALLWLKYFSSVIEHEYGHIAINEDFAKKSTTVTGLAEGCFKDVAIQERKSQLIMFTKQWEQIELEMLKMQHDQYHSRVGESISLPPGFSFK